MQWQIDGHYIIACSCDPVCPCNFGNRPTQGFCEGCSLLLIERGEYEDEQIGRVALGGFKCGFASTWPGPIYDGGGVATLYIDADQGSPEWNALTQIITGNAGGPLFPILDSTYRRRLGPYRVLITINVAGQPFSADVAGKQVQMIFGRFVDTVSSSERYQVRGPTEQYVLDKFSVDDPNAGLNFNYDGKCGQYARVTLKGP
jgi:hypothetical protein